MEATPGFEPGIRALQAPALATWPRRLWKRYLSGRLVEGQYLPSHPVHYSNTSENENPAIGRADFQMYWSGRRELNPRRQPWQGCTLPLSYSRSNSPMGSVNLAIAVDRVNSSPHFSPAFCCGRRCTAPSGVFSFRGARRTVKYDSAPLRSKTPLGTAPRTPRDETW